MKVRFSASGASTKLLDPVDDLGLEEGEWESYSCEQKMSTAIAWANKNTEVRYDEVPEDLF